MIGLIKLVVFKEFALGYILPKIPDKIQILHGSILKGYWGDGVSNWISKESDVRLASKKDFDEFRCCFDGFDNRLVYEFKQ